MQVFFTICEVEKAQRSQIDRLGLCMVFREKLLKKYSLKCIYKTLVNDLKKLEGGIKISFPMIRTVKCGILCYAADNLEVGLLHFFLKVFKAKFYLFQSAHAISYNAFSLKNSFYTGKVLQCKL